MNHYFPVPPPQFWRHDPARLRALLAERGLTGSAAGALIGVDARTVRRWLSAHRGASQMPYSAWYALCCIAHSRITGF